MKIVRTALFAVIVLLFTTGNTFAANIFAGGKAFYAFWDPYLKDVPGAYANAEGTGWQLLDTGGGWMYGPTASVSFFDDLSISLTYLQGTLLSKLDGNWHYTESWGPREVDASAAGSATAKRQDIDAVVSYNIGSSFKIFAGYKYQPLDMTIKQKQYMHSVDASGVTDEGVSDAKMEFETKYNSPALGIGYSLPFADMFAFTVNVSGLYVKGTSKLERTDNTVLGVNTPPAGTPNLWEMPNSNSFTADMDIKGWGYNIEPSIVTILKDNILFVIGFRYQSIKIEGTMKNTQNVHIQGTNPPTSEQDQDVTMKDLNDTVYGITFTALYKFDI